MDGSSVAPLRVVEMSEKIARLLGMDEGEVRIEILLRDCTFRTMYLHRERMEEGQLRRFDETERRG